MQSAKDGDDGETYAKLKRQASARRARERELERKRARGEISCAECRRLKLKCNKKIPCNSCIRRGCHSICPNGLLTTGQGSRFVLANTDKLHGKLIQMSQRIRQLEDALQIAHSSVSGTPHPLLSDPLLAIKSGVDGLTNEDNEKEEAEVADEEEEMTTAFGTLTVADCGASRFVGRVAAETLLMNEPDNDGYEHSFMNAGPDSSLERKLPESLTHAAKGFPLSQVQLPKEELLALLVEHLPTYERATALAEAYLENICWLPRSIQRDQIMEDLLPMLYKGKSLDLSSRKDDMGKYDGKHKMHHLALALALFACGAAGDLTLPPSNSEGKTYHTLALAALNTHSVMSPGGASLETVQTITLIAQYDFFSGDKSTLEAGWKIVSFALIVAASIGLHRDPAHWNLEPRYIQRRRFVFWEIFCLDKYKSLGTGRPSIFRLQETDCEFPEDQDAFVDHHGNEQEGLTRWRHRFVRDVVGPISEHLCLTRPIKYSEILDFDRRIREFGDPPIPPNLTDSGPSAELRPRMWVMQKELTLLTIHKNFFARAMIKDPENPLRSPFAPSFLAAYACSIKLLRNVRMCFEHLPGILIRLWPIWTHCLTSGVVIGSVASNVNQLALANAAFHDLDLVVNLFREASSHPVARNGLPILYRLRERALTALQKKANETGVPPGMTIPKVEVDEIDELSILHGSARLVHRMNRTKAEVCGSGSPARRGSSDDASTPKSGATSNIDSSPSMPTSETSFSSQPRQQVALAGTSSVVKSDTSAAHPSQAQYSVPSTSTSFDQDIVSLFNMIYSPSNNISGSDATASPFEFNQKFPGPGPQSQTQPTGQQFPPAPHGPFDTSSSFVASSSPWVPEAAQLEAIISSTYGGLQGPFESVPNVTTAAPSYDMTWINDDGSNKAPEFSGDTAQFVEDWRSQAAIEGTYFLTEPEVDARMTF
ncbi:hypothetical protein A7U60_g3191 [Sanghuangporus baumii]|uniref:Zn(2)-C6 fungal-type domain-containing protein n=1 Tax=Sanghuangporus baumii TaxID=108892 RepID=A0A9Q5I0U0_SANBA|nr:hypothetical protein A7U60_g3191 [Sanghuangporus baumii]